MIEPLIGGILLKVGCCRFFYELARDLENRVDPERQRGQTRQKRDQEYPVKAVEPRAQYPADLCVLNRQLPSIDFFLILYYS